MFFRRAVSLARSTVPSVRTLATRQMVHAKPQLSLRQFGAVAGVATGCSAIFFSLKPFSMAMAEAAAPPKLIAPTAAGDYAPVVHTQTKDKLVIASWNSRIWAFL